MLWAIWYHLYNFKTRKTPMVECYFAAYNFTKSSTPPEVIRGFNMVLEGGTNKLQSLFLKNILILSLPFPVLILENIQVFYTCHCKKSVHIQNYSGPYFPAFWLSMERYLRTKSECRKIGLLTPKTDVIYPMCISMVTGESNWNISIFFKNID